MYSVTVEADFSSAHNLRGYKGKCEALHGHNWRVEVEARQKELDDAGMVMDFKVLKKRLRALLETIDHAYLNTIPYFKKVNPTSENIARYLFDALKARIPGLYRVTVWESENSHASYFHPSPLE